VIDAFGPQAARFAQRLGDVAAIVADAEGAGDARREAAKRRRTGAPVYGMVVFDDPRVAFAYRHAEEILAQVADYDFRRLILDQLLLGALPINGTRIDVLWQPDGATLTAFTEFLALCDTVLVRSFTEVARMRDWFRSSDPGRPFPPVERVLATAGVPVVERVRPERPGVVVWAPERPALETALHLHALTEFHGDVTCVSAGGPRPSRSPATFLDPSHPGVRRALSTAAAIVCVDPCDPSAAVAFARLGYGVVAPATSGAHEFAGDVVTWDALDARFLSTAVAVAATRS
jgi:hypothetical protein